MKKITSHRVHKAERCAAVGSAPDSDLVLNCVCSALVYIREVSMLRQKVVLMLVRLAERSTPLNQS